MPSSPQKPRQRRTSSTDSVSSALRRETPRNSTPDHRKASFGRSSPISSAFLSSAREADSSSPDSSHVADRLGGFQEGTNGLGNLAEELADVWDDDGEHDPAQSQCGEQVHCAAALPPVTSTWGAGHNEPSVLSDTAHDFPHSRHHKSGFRPAVLDGDSSDSEDANQISTTLEASMTTIDNLVKQESATSGTEQDEVVCRVTDALRKLPSQSGIENGTSRFDFHVLLPPVSFTQLVHRGDSLIC